MLDKEIRFTLRSFLEHPLIAGIGAVFVMFLVWKAIYACWDTSSVGSWVQAIGSIAAIIAAIWISNEKDHRDEQQRKFRESVWRKNLSCQIESTIDYLDTLIGIESGMGIFTQTQLVDWVLFNRLHAEELDDLSKIDLVKADQPSAVELVSKLKRHMRSAGHFSGLLVNGVSSEHPHVLALKQHLDAAAGIAIKIKIGVGEQAA